MLLVVMLVTFTPFYYSLQRVKPNDPILSFRACERHTFSMRNDREVRAKDVQYSAPLCLATKQ